MKTRFSFKFTIVAVILALGAVLTLNGCSSASRTHGAKAPDGRIYGSGPNHTEPYPQDKPVDLRGVKGSAIRYEAPSRGGNKDYTVLGQNYEVWNDLTSYQEIGTASWYGPGFHGNQTSNGERYNQKGFSAAHKNLPLPSYLKVTNLSNGKAVVVRVNDRGPFHGDRILDLSEGAANAINMKQTGTAKVKLEYLKVCPGNLVANAVNAGSYQQSKPAYTPDYSVRPAPSMIASSSGRSGAYVQLFSSSSAQRASQIKARVSDLTSYPVQVIAEAGLYRVRVGPLKEDEAGNALADLRGQGYPDSFIKRI